MKVAAPARSAGGSRYHRRFRPTVSPNGGMRDVLAGAGGATNFYGAVCQVMDGIRLYPVTSGAQITQ